MLQTITEQAIAKKKKNIFQENYLNFGKYYTTQNLGIIKLLEERIYALT
jgi:hypothetical protein